MEGSNHSPQPVWHELLKMTVPMIEAIATPVTPFKKDVMSGPTRKN
jgi:hypothetical protein